MSEPPADCCGGLAHVWGNYWTRRAALTLSISWMIAVA
jgi:hypothetical protein